MEKVREKDKDNIEKPVVDRTFDFEEFNYYPTKEDYYRAREETLRKTTMKLRTNDLYQMLLKDELDLIVRYKAANTEMAAFSEKLDNYFETRRKALVRAKLPEYEDRLKELSATRAAIRNITKEIAVQNARRWKYGVSCLQPGDKVAHLVGLECDFEEPQVIDFASDSDITEKLRELTIEKKSDYQLDHKALAGDILPATYTVIGFKIDNAAKIRKCYAELKSLEDGKTHRVRASYSLGKIVMEKTRNCADVQPFNVLVKGKFFNKKSKGNLDLRVELLAAGELA
jgi:hypothetical protein